MLNPWEATPYNLVSWWDMENFSAVAFWKIAIMLVRVETAYSKFEGASKVGALDEEHLAVKAHRDITKACDEIGLTTSSKCSSHIVSELLKGGLTALAFRELLAQLENNIRWEIEDQLFLYVPPRRAECYDHAELLGKETLKKFPAIQFDVVEAGNCYACGRGTAAVFHLMRIMEVGVQEFGNKLGVPFANERNWQNILNDANKEIGKLDPRDDTTKELAALAANLYSVKLAWRNEVMHPKDTYTLEEADNLIRQVKIFMEQLAKIV